MIGNSYFKNDKHSGKPSYHVGYVAIVPYDGSKYKTYRARVKKTRDSTVILHQCTHKHEMVYGKQGALACGKQWAYLKQAEDVNVREDSGIHQKP